MEKETARIEGFSDGVFAICITLLVLELKVPDEAAGHNPALLFSSLIAQWPEYVSFSISFLSIFIMWVNHHKIFKQIYKRTTYITFANGFVLFLASIVSYFSKLLSTFYQTNSEQMAISLYIGLFIMVNISFILLWQSALRNREVLRPGLSEAQIAGISRNYFMGFPGYLGAFIISFIYPHFSLLVCVGLWLFWAYSSKKLDIE